MIRTRTAVAIAMLCVAIAAAGCGVGPGESSEGTARLTVTHDYGSELIARATESDPPESETVLRLLDREAEITTRYGGGFVQSIDGVAGSSEGGRLRDWFFFVNGIESSTGSAEVNVRAGDRVWWDYRDWTDVMRAPAVVGSWPAPFANSTATLECFAENSVCELARETLEDVGAEPATAVTSGWPRLLVGTWDSVRRDRAAAQIEEGPATSGVFARFVSNDNDWTLAGLDETGSTTFETDDGGLVAAVRNGDDPPTWVATGTNARMVREAVDLLSESALRDHYAVVVDGATPVAVPVQ